MGEKPWDDRYDLVGSHTGLDEVEPIGQFDRHEVVRAYSAVPAFPVTDVSSAEFPLDITTYLEQLLSP